jgi:hypothetical protein
MPFYLPFGKAEVEDPPQEGYPISPLRGIFDLRCQGFAVKYYSFTLGALDLPAGRDLRGASLLRRIFDLDFCNVRVYSM